MFRSALCFALLAACALARPQEYTPAQVRRRIQNLGWCIWNAMFCIYVFVAKTQDIVKAVKAASVMNA